MKRKKVMKRLRGEMKRIANLVDRPTCDDIREENGCLRFV